MIWNSNLIQDSEGSLVQEDQISESSVPNQVFKIEAFLEGEKEMALTEELNRNSMHRQPRVLLSRSILLNDSSESRE